MKIINISIIPQNEILLQNLIIPKINSGGDKVFVDKYYVLKDGSSLKDIAELYFLNEAIGYVIKKTPYDKNKVESANSSYETDNKSGYLGIYANGCSNSSEIEQYINSIFSTLEQNPLNEEDFKNIKQNVKNNLENDFKSSYSRADLILKLSDKEMKSFADFEQELDKITPLDIQSAAKNYSGSCAVIRIEE